MTKHYSSNNNRLKQKQQQQEEPPTKEKGWYCLLHHIKYLCSQCGHENKRQKEIKYYFRE